MCISRVLIRGGAIEAESISKVILLLQILRQEYQEICFPKSKSHVRERQCNGIHIFDESPSLPSCKPFHVCARKTRNHHPVNNRWVRSSPIMVRGTLTTSRAGTLLPAKGRSPHLPSLNRQDRQVSLHHPCPCIPVFYKTLLRFTSVASHYRPLQNGRQPTS